MERGRRDIRSSAAIRTKEMGILAAAARSSADGEGLGGEAEGEPA